MTNKFLSKKTFYYLLIATSMGGKNICLKKHEQKSDLSDLDNIPQKAQHTQGVPNAQDALPQNQRFTLPQTPATSSSNPLASSDPITPQPPQQSYPLVGISNTSAHCWANAALQVVHAFYREEIRKHPNSHLERIMQQMDTAITHKQKQITISGLADLIQEVNSNNTKQNSLNHYNIGDVNKSITFLADLNSIYKFYPEMYSTVYKDSLCQVIHSDQNPISDYKGCGKQEAQNCDGTTSITYRKVNINPQSKSLYIPSSDKCTQQDTLKIEPQYFEINKQAYGKPALTLEAVVYNIVGHWLCYIKKQNQWYSVSDDKVTPATLNDVLVTNTNSILYFYKVS